MPRIDPVNTERASAKVADLLREYESRSGGRPGPMVRTMANSTALLRGYLDLTRAMKRAHLDRRVREQISVAIQAWLGCDYCVEAHTAAARAVGVDEGEIELARQGTSRQPKIAAVIAFAIQVLVAPAEIADADVEGLRAHGWRDEQIADVVGLVALNLLTGAFNLVAGIHRVRSGEA